LEINLERFLIKGDLWQYNIEHLPDLNKALVARAMVAVNRIEEEAASGRIYKPLKRWISFSHGRRAFRHFRWTQILQGWAGILLNGLLYTLAEPIASTRGCR